jgi:hypothetical protein
MLNHLTYQNVVEELLARVPSFAELRKEDDSYVSYRDDSPHLVFGDFARFLLERLNAPSKTGEDELILQRGFKLLDEMLTSSDPEVVNLAEVGVFEAFAEQPEALAIAKCYLSEEANIILEEWLKGWLEWLQQN